MNPDTFPLGLTPQTERRRFGNPIIPFRGVNDPHIHIFDDVAYLYASHDASPDSVSFAMADWQVWSSSDLVNWTHRSTLLPVDTYLVSVPGFTQAWATDAGEKDGLYYWYFSEGNTQIGVVVSETPVGPWRDPVGHAMIAEGSTRTQAYDPGIFAEGNDRYIVFGCWNYHIAKLADDMISLAEAPREIVITGAKGPYTDAVGTPHDGRQTDDKPFLHKFGGRYYLSWGVFYALSDTIDGPFRYAGSILDDTSFPTGLNEPTWPEGPQQGRHGSFFEWHGQTYFAYCDISQTANRYFRDTFISYVHYRADGTMAPIRVDRIGVGMYDAASGPIQAEDFFSIEGAEKIESARASSGFVVSSRVGVSARLSYPMIHGLGGRNTIVLEVLSDGATVEIEIRRQGRESVAIRHEQNPNGENRRQIAIPLSALSEEESIDICWSVVAGTLAIDQVRFH